MLTTLIRWALPVILCTCAPAQDKSTPAAADRLFTEAYGNLDAALLERLLAEDFYLRHPGNPTVIGGPAFLAEVGQMRQLFPDLEVKVDSFSLATGGAGTVSSGIRTFAWSTGKEAGSFSERYANYWSQHDAGWLLDSAVVAPKSPR